MARYNKLYTTPILCQCKDGEWYVLFRFWDQTQKKYITFKRSEGLNRIHDQKEKLAEFKALREAREIWLKMGWNPIIDPEFSMRAQAQIISALGNPREWTVEFALKHAVKHKKMAEKSRYDYKKSVEYFVDSARLMYFHAIPIGTITRKHIKAVFNHLQNEIKLSNKNYNKRLEHIKSLLSELIEWEALDFNPAFGMKELNEEETIKFIPLTPEEKEQVREYLYIENYRFLVFCMTIYYTGIRPDEILSLRVGDINIENNTIHLKPYSNVVKNKKERWKLLHPNLKTYYDQMEIHECPADHFIFSYNFQPGPKKIRRQLATELWKKYVWNELGIEKYMYSLKHLGADDLIDAGADEKNVQDHLGHSSKFMTRRYTQKGIAQSRDVIMKTNIQF